MSKWYDEFRTIVVNNLGRINPRSVTEQYFSNIGKIELWQTFLTQTTHLGEYPFTKRIKFLEAGHFTEHPNCYCGKPVSIIQNKVSKYCSQKCQLSAPERCRQISITKKNQDHTAINKKREETMIQKYGVAYNSQRADIHHLWEKSKLSAEIENKLKDKNWLNIEYNDKKRTAVDIADELDCFYGTVIDYCHQHGFKIRKRTNYSLIEVKVSRWLTEIGIEHELGNYDIIKPYEIDVVIPSHKVGIEINGLHWHNESKKPKNFHKVKTDMAKSSGWHLFHITDLEWNTQQDIVKSMIMSKLGLNKKIGARKCELRHVPSKEAKLFLEKNHVQGYAAAKVNLGLYYENDLVMVATFNVPRFNKSYDWELIRLSTKIGVTVVGGMTKLLKEFTGNYSGTLMSYVDRKYGDGKGFLASNFSQVGESNPGYHWTDGNVLISRFKTQKKQLANWLKNFDPKKSETENMLAAGFNRIWDSGQLIMVYGE